MVAPPRPHSRMIGTPSIVSRPPRPLQAGFALLITVTLVAFLVLVLVSLATLTRVETSVAANSQTLSQSRQNALLALNVALGQLQKYSGPDRRVTARADIMTVADKLTRDNAGEPVVNDIANVHWTGVWDSSMWNPLTGDYDGSPRGRGKPQPMTWLVSGNEDVDDPRKYEPAGALPADSTATPKRTLVNGVAADGSADPNNPLVEVPVVRLTDDNMPGLAGPQTVGHYAWWVGDEGVKAKLSTVSSETIAGSTKPLAPTSGDARLYYWKAMSPVRAGAELAGAPGSRLFPGFIDIFATDASGVDLRDGMRRVLDSRQLPLIHEGGGTAILPSVSVRRHRSDFTTLSRGVLTDTVRGGLRLDLTRYLETGNTDGAFNANEAIYADAVSAGIVGGDRLPAFSLLKSWYDAGRTLSGGGFNAIASIHPETTSGNVITGQGVFPVLTRYQIALAAISDGPGMPLKLVFHPAVTLWNPHNVTLAAEDLVLELEEQFDFRFSVEAINAAGNTTRSYLNASTVSGYNYSGASLYNMGIGNPAVFRMRIPGVELAPGESLVLTLKGDGNIPSVEPAPGPGALAASYPVMEPYWNDKTFLSVDTGLTLDSAPLQAGEYLKFFMGRGVGQPFRFKARLYRESDHATGVTLQKIEQAFNEGDTQNPKGDLTGLAPPHVLTATPPTDTAAYRTNVVAMRLPYTKESSGTAITAPAVPFARFNIRAARGVNTSFERADQSLAGDAFFECYRQKGLAAMPAEPGATRDLGFVGPLGQSRLVGAVNQGNYAVFFDYPRTETAVSGNANYPAVVSLGQFQHADLGSNALDPTYAFANSWPDPRIARESVAGKWSGFPASTDSRHTVFSGNDHLMRDVSYLTNHGLWDRFFLSTIPQHSADGLFNESVVLPNGRMQPVPGMIAGIDGYPKLSDVRDAGSAAGSLLLDGAFNINSTSVDSWRALLGGLGGIIVPDSGWAQDGVSSGGTNTPEARGLRHNYSRFLLPRGRAFDQTDASFGPGDIDGGLSRAAWTGHRYLTDDEIDTLARNIVDEVRVRGPFMSLADFVNRRLVTAGADGSTNVTTDLDEHRLKVGVLGALQKAILNLRDVSQGLNASLNQPAMASSKFNYTGGTAKVFRDGAVNSDTSYRGLNNYPSQLELLNGGLLGQLNYGAPGFLTQADVLQKIGGVIAARSDTFVIRTYGDSVNPATGDTTGQAWCEAVVQRLPEYVDSAQPPETRPADLNTINGDFGRRYRVVSFRWLAPNEL